MVSRSYGGSPVLRQSLNGKLGASKIVRTRKVKGFAALLLGICSMAFMAPMAQALPKYDREGPKRVEEVLELVPRRPLIGHLRFCILYEGHCDFASDRRDQSRDSQDHWNDLMRVNYSVNRTIRPRSDGHFDSWNVNVSEGDCEDYALQKRHDLISLGWPSSALRIAIVRTKQGQPHAILLARIAGEDYALDNLTAQVRPWQDTDHIFLMIQDGSDPRLWHDVRSPRLLAGSS